MASPLSEKEFQEMQQWAGAGIVESQSVDELMRLAKKTDAYLVRALQELARVRAAPQRSALDEIEVALISIADGANTADAVQKAFDVINRERLNS